ncbi:D-isomer specific 2-hydroxyacid dehydrogenase family protein [Nonomuraea gerenzanensis]|uniref:D-3-phosphoglycerate dehydrogenase n=1 Tax=Nonomuraea gerenzanensis TaxID=93944 RepID=A0A1M4E861_9ACTN|nr:D-isomer specific 2-hydroxyacid dehydrogenase family protein [Nonomuraea gerenzanensis]UBU17320.1 D-isomer specific 2-hydroxyacid dehydrogenase family protein [Nonomuraea gerenzanensis]SBO95067.1 D-3-phosphoglycerate dehydrogenase [Nonomuraea gerenzanensis]
MTVAVHVGPEPVPALIEAVHRAGARVVPLAEAEAIVYYGNDDPAEVRSMLHEGIRWVQLPHAGVERWADAGVITEHPVFTAATGSYGQPVAEHALALMLAAARGLHRLARATTWGPNTSSELTGSTVAIVGCGGIGRALIAMLEPFRCRVIAVSDSGEVPGAAEVLPRARYREALPEAAYVVVAAPATPGTRGMFGAYEFGLMRRDAWLVNVARGGLVVTGDLVEALRAGRLGGAALDVTDPEPLPDGHPLWSLENVLITPHSANPRPAYWRGLAERVTSNVRRFGAGLPLEGVVSPDRGF